MPFPLETMIKFLDIIKNLLLEATGEGIRRKDLQGGMLRGKKCHDAALASAAFSPRLMQFIWHLAA